MTPPGAATPLPYSAWALDRVPDLRGDEAAVAALARDAALRVVPVWRGRVLCTAPAGLPRPLDGATARAALDAGRDVVLLGRDGTAPVFASDLSELTERDAVGLCGASATADVRHVMTAMPAGDAALAALARGVLHWSRNARFCGACGAASTPQAGGIPRQCSRAGCGRVEFPRLEPAVIVVVRSSAHPDRCLLARHRGASTDGWATIAGFVEVGESLEDAVRREVREETGLRVTGVEYVASQPWPFPAGIMLGFLATAVDDDDLRVDAVELTEARWFDRDAVAELERRGRPDSIERHLLRHWLAGTRPGPAGPHR